MPSLSPRLVAIGWEHVDMKHLASQIAGWVRLHVPESWLGWLRRLRYLGKRKQYYVDRITGATIGEAQLVHSLQLLGLQRGDVLLVHSSLSRLGQVESGAKTVIQALLSVIGPEGTLVMPSFTLPRGSMLEQVQSGRVFDVRTSKSDTGKITEEFRLWPGVIRSLHPTHSVAALGPLAEHLTRGHELCATPFGPGSPFARLLLIKSKALCLGVDVTYITIYHAFEDLAPDFPEPVYLPSKFQCTVIDQQGQQHQVLARVHDPLVAERRIDSRPEVLARMKAALKEKGILTEGMVGKGMSYVVPIPELLQVLNDLMRQGITIYADK